MSCGGYCVGCGYLDHRGCVCEEIEQERAQRRAQEEVERRKRADYDERRNVHKYWIDVAQRKTKCREVSCDEGIPKGCARVRKRLWVGDYEKYYYYHLPCWHKSGEAPTNHRPLDQYGNFPKLPLGLQQLVLESTTSSPKVLCNPEDEKAKQAKPRKRRSEPSKDNAKKQKVKADEKVDPSVLEFLRNLKRTT